MAMIRSLDGVTSGGYRVTTDSGSVYSLDLDRMIFTRLPAMDMGADRSLRRDGEQVDLLMLVQCRIGQPAVLIINLHWPNVPSTLRRTTPVIAIENVSQCRRQ